MWIASATVPREIFRFDAQGKRGKFVVWVRFGDYQAEMAGVVQNLIEAQKYAADETQKQMLEAYIQHFQVGNMFLRSGGWDGGVAAYLVGFSRGLLVIARCS